MLFIFRLLALPVTDPVRGFRFILEQIRDQALAEMLTEEQIQALLIESSLRHQTGEISDEEYEEIENRLIDELNMVRSLTSQEYDEYPPEFQVAEYDEAEVTQHEGQSDQQR